MQPPRHGLRLAVLATAIVPAALAAQGRAVHAPPASRIAVTLAAPPRGDMPGQWRNQPGDPLGMPLSADGRLHGWGIPWILETTQTVPVPTPVPYAVPYPYPVAARAEPVRPAPPPYDPTKARMRIIGSGTDGGGGVMRVEHLAGDSLRVTWLGTPRPIREARLFLADESYQPLRTRTIDAQHREARFRTTGMARTARYAGSTVVFADGSEHTMLVPLASRPVAPVPATR